MYYVFLNHICITSGSLNSVALRLKERDSELSTPVIVIDGENGRQLDLNLSGTLDDVGNRYPEQTQELAEAEEKPDMPKRRGRPKLGVTGREITLLPRHWDWLDSQRGGASATLRKLIDQARREYSKEDAIRVAQDKTNRFLSAIAGDLPQYEGVTRALFAGHESDFKALIKAWPKDVKTRVLEFSTGAF